MAYGTYTVSAWSVLERRKGTSLWNDLMGTVVGTVSPTKLPVLFNTRKEARDSARMTWKLESSQYRRYHRRPTVVRVECSFQYNGHDVGQ